MNANSTTTKRDDFIPPDEGAEFALVSIEAQIEQARRLLHERARELAKRFVERREAEGDGTFCPLNLLVRRRNNSIQLSWVLYHFKKGVRTGTTNIKKNKGSAAYDMASIKARAPDWLQAAAVETEEAARPIREALSQLVRMSRTLSVVDDRASSIFVRINGGEDVVYEELDPDDPLNPNN